MDNYEQMIQNLLDLKEEVKDEKVYYQCKIEEFNEKLNALDTIYIEKKEELDKYVLENYNKNKLKAWEHFLTTTKTDVSLRFFKAFLKNTGISISNSEKIKIIIKPLEIVNIRKTVDTIDRLFQIAQMFNLEDFRLAILNIESSKSGELFLTKESDVYYVKADNAKRATFRESSGVIVLNKIIEMAKKK